MEIKIRLPKEQEKTPLNMAAALINNKVFNNWSDYKELAEFLLIYAKYFDENKVQNNVEKEPVSEIPPRYENRDKSDKITVVECPYCKHLNYLSSHIIEIWTTQPNRVIKCHGCLEDISYIPELVKEV